MQKYLNIIPYFGGKYPHLKWLINKFPSGNFHFIDAMGGGGNVAINVHYPLITYNDVNDEVVNLFHVLLDHYDEFIRKIYFTPFSRVEYNRIITDAINQVPLDNIERARRYFIKSQLGYGANGSQNNHYGCSFDWKLYGSNFYKVDNFNLKIQRLGKIIEKLRHIQIEKRDALELFDKVNIKGNIVYFDPPYLLSLRKSKKRYLHEVDDDFHKTLAGKIKNARCHVAISGYNSPLYNEIFKELHKSVNQESKTNTGKVMVSECLWTNYNPETINGSYKLQF
jgi:DNA adenine methylase